MLGIESPYDLTLGMPRLAKYQPWIDWRTRTLASSTQDIGKDMLLREAYITDVVTDTVDRTLTGYQTSLHCTQSPKPGAYASAPTKCLVAQIPTQLVESEVVEKTMTSSHVSPSPAQSIEPVAVDGELTRSQASHKPAQCLKLGAVGKGALARSATAPVSQS